MKKNYRRIEPTGGGRLSPEGELRTPVTFSKISFSDRQKEVAFVVTFRGSRPRLPRLPLKQRIKRSDKSALQSYHFLQKGAATAHTFSQKSGKNSLRYYENSYLLGV